MITGGISPTDSSDGQKPNVLYESSDGLKANILYETSEPQPSSSSEYADVQKKSKPKFVSPNDVYAVVDKSKKEDVETKNDVYAEVVKKKEGMEDGKCGKAGKAGKGGKKGKGKQKKGGAKQRDDVYENVDDIGGANKNIYSNFQEGANSVLDKEPSRKMNKDGLIYLDIEFKEDKKNGRNYVIHGIENRTDYADVDFTQHADPLPSDEEESTNKGAGILE
ncbi:uncharacterized protein [Argopecten irradians]|uniref:uncharacterized protein n=1 Tax=Argopecten irradians TaxID=31199 RepID=UPI00371D5CCD